MHARQVDDVNDNKAMEMCQRSTINCQLEHEICLCKCSCCVLLQYVRNITHHTFPGELQKGEFRYRQRGNLVVTTWRDKRLVYVMSTNTPPTATNAVSRRGKDRTKEQIPCPLSGSQYNRFMAGVDKSD